MNLLIDIQSDSSEPPPIEGDFQRWISAALTGLRDRDTEISLRIVDEAEMAELNQTWRGKTGPTNVLSFPCDFPEELDIPLLGDIVICAPVVRTEAQQQNKSLEAHWAHMSVHGTLHLLGYDHIEDAEAEEMEALESQILTSMNYPCPYGTEQSEEPVQA